jgi:hypothetical protein
MSRYYYLGVDARITRDVVESRRPAPQRFLIADLYDIHTIGPIRARAEVGPCLTGVSTVLAAADRLVINHPAVSLVLTGAAIVAAAVAGAGWATRRRPFELRAIYHGQVVCVFETTDRLVIGQITRALGRAIEDRQPGQLDQ